MDRLPQLPYAIQEYPIKRGGIGAVNEQQIRVNKQRHKGNDPTGKGEEKDGSCFPTHGNGHLSMGKFLLLVYAKGTSIDGRGDGRSFADI